MNLNMDIQYIKGIGPKKAYKLNKLGIFTLKDMIYYFPRSFEDRGNFKKICTLEQDEKVSVKAVIISITSKEVKNKMEVINVVVKDETGFLTLTFFNQSYIKKYFKVNDYVLAFGKVKKEYGKVYLTSCEIEHLNKASSFNITPVYPLTYGVTNNEIVSIFKTIFNNEIKVKEYLPLDVIKKHNLCSIDYAIKNIHFPSSKEALKVALYRIVFEEFLALQLGLFMFKTGINDEIGISFDICDLDEIKKVLPFELTNAQNRTLNEILQDMNSTKVMNRLVQGDVGSGKTVVALIAIFNAVKNNYQASLMAPTEILAEQHYSYFCEILEKLGIKTGLLVGSLTKKKKEEVLFKVKNGEIDVLIGTHALIEDNVEFNNLGFVITDEQHRFGVKQRNKLSKKGNNPDILVMTATPIPRTLALILYGDLDISIIDELPPGRQKIDTMAIEKSKRASIYNSFVRKEVQKGRQVYIVCPLVEESENIDAKSAVELLEELKSEFFSDLRLGLLHGKMKSSEKDSIMKSFKNQEIDILVSTTVIEVGVNVPNATLMIIENAERFGLAQLHQLRGRVGRGSEKSYCVLVYNSKTEVCKQRMNIMQETNDGFKISEKDLEIRGPGEFFGTKQHGIPELKVANIFKHMKILKLAQNEAKEILLKDINLKNNIELKRYIVDKFEKSLKEISLN